MNTRNLVFINGDGMVNVQPEKSTVPINDDWYCEMTDTELSQYLAKHELNIDGLGQIVEGEDGYIYGKVLVLSK